ncbi:MAG: hypothetical protein R3F34_06580 [Planctomycetota bacterium]
MRASNPTIVLALSSVLALASCASEREPAPVPTGPAPPAERAEVTWTVVATYVNPSLSEEGRRADEQLHAALEAAGIRSISAGSAGFSLNVAPEDAGRALAIVRRTIAEQHLEASAVEPRDGEEERSASR